MNAPIENGFVTYLLAQLATANIVGVQVKAGTSETAVPNSAPSVIVIIKTINDVGDYWTGFTTVVISTPAKVQGATLAGQNTLVAAIKEALAPNLQGLSGDDLAAAEANQQALSDAVKAASHYETRGFYFKTITDAQDANMWQATLEMEWGLQGPLPD